MFLFLLLSDLQTITARLDAVSALLTNEELFHGLRSSLSFFPDVDHQLALCAQVPKHETEHIVEGRITTLIQLKHTIEKTRGLRAMLESMQHVEECTESETVFDVADQHGTDAVSPRTSVCNVQLIQGCLKVYANFCTMKLK